MVEALMWFVGMMLSLAGVSYAVSIVLSYFALRRSMDPKDLRLLLFAPVVRLGAISVPLLATLILFAFLGAEVPSFTIVLVLLVAPALLAALLVSSCLLLAKMLVKYGRLIWPGLLSQLPTSALSASLIFVVVKGMSALIPEAYLGLFLVYTAVFAAYGCMSYQPSFLFSR